MEFELVQISGAERKAFIESWEEAFCRTLNQAVYGWIFNDRNIMYAACVDGEITAGYCLYPLDCIYRGRQDVALLCNNVFVNPRHQGKQLFVELGRLALEDVGQRSLARLAFGIPNALALPGHKRVGWGVQPSIPFLEKHHVAFIGNATSTWQSSSLTPVQREQIEYCSWAAANGREFSILKTIEFQRWRYEEKPGVQYRFGLRYQGATLTAYCVCKVYEADRALHFIDIDGTCKVDVGHLVREAESLPGEFDRVNVWGSTAHRDVFAACGYGISDKTDSLIFIEPLARKAIFMDEGVNLCLGDNDVY